MTKQKQVLTDPTLLIIDDEKDIRFIKELINSLIIEVLKQYKVRKYFNKYYLVPIFPEKMQISEEEAKAVNYIQHMPIRLSTCKLLVEDIK